MSISIKEVEKLYEAYHVKTVETRPIRNTINEGTIFKETRRSTTSNKSISNNVAKGK